ncbi:MAG TPA: hypothetical protein VF062_28845 [Candidatus Limnocylindrales bacterium]
MTLYATPSPDQSLDPQPATTTLLTMARALLTVVETSAAGLGIPLPDRRVIYMAPIPADCPQVAVLVGGWTMDPAGEGMIACERARWAAQLGIIITRKTPAVPTAAGDLPTPASMMQAAQLASDDAEILLEVVGSLQEVADVLVETPAAEGGLQSATVSFRTPAFGGI